MTKKYVQVSSAGDFADLILKRLGVDNYSQELLYHMYYNVEESEKYNDKEKIIEYDDQDTKKSWMWASKGYYVGKYGLSENDIEIFDEENSLMNEHEIQKELNLIKNSPRHVKPVPGARTIYLAGGWWGKYQPRLLIDAYKALLSNPTVAHVHVPLLHQYGGNAFVDGEFEPDHEWATMTYKADLRGIDNTDITVALFPVKDQDTGTAVEVGYAKGTNKPVVGVFKGDAHKDPINLMISMSADASLNNADILKYFDFMDIQPNMYDGRLI